MTEIFLKFIGLAIQFQILFLIETIVFLFFIATMIRWVIVSVIEAHHHSVLHEKAVVMHLEQKQQQSQRAEAEDKNYTSPTTY